MPVAFLTTVYSSKSRNTFVPKVGICVLFSTGVVCRSTGGMVSFGPPCGGVVVFAHDRLNRQQAAKRRSAEAVVIIRFISVTPIQYV